MYVLVALEVVSSQQAVLELWHVEHDGDPFQTLQWMFIKVTGGVGLGTKENRLDFETYPVLDPESMFQL